MDRFRFTVLAKCDTQQTDIFLSDNGLKYEPVSAKTKSLLEYRSCC